MIRNTAYNSCLTQWQVTRIIEHYTSINFSSFGRTGHCVLTVLSSEIQHLTNHQTAVISVKAKQKKQIK